MKKLLISLVLCVPFILNAQDKDSYTMYETIYLTPDGKNLKKLNENLKAHNKKYHNKAPYSAFVFAVSNGPNAGQIIWMMGPLKYADLDTRPGKGEHNEDWDSNVVPYLAGSGTVEYWKRDDKLSNVVGDPRPINYNRFWKVNLENGFLVRGLLKQISETVKALEGENPWSVWDNEFRQGAMGRHIVTSTGMKNWAEMDDDDKFKETFEKVHGEDAWMPFVQSMGLAFEDSFDEIWTIIPELTGTETE
jgi:hypothetical protein